jgi:hypothetical protein
MTAAAATRGSSRLRGARFALLVVAASTLLTVGCTTAAPDPAPTNVPPTAPAQEDTTWPTASTTGVPAGVKLKHYDGPLEITVPGTVIDGYEIEGTVSILAPRVTIRNSRVYGRIDTGDANKYRGTMLRRVEIIGPYSGGDGGHPAVGYTGFTCDGCNVRGWTNGFGLVADVTVKNSWVHDIIVHGDPANGGSHNQAILSLGGRNFTIVGNRLDAGEAPNVTAALALMSQLEPFKNVLVKDNLFDGGGYCVYAGDAGEHGATNTRFLDNTFGDKYSSTCGGFGPVTAFTSGSGNRWAGNVLQSTGEPVSVTL